MSNLKHPLCFLLFLWRSLRLGYLVDGHDYELTDEGPENVEILRCRRCGHLSIGWYW